MMSSSFITLDHAVKIEEETMPTYGLYYPVRLGHVFKSRYQVLSKMGYGANSTVWFCRDLEQHDYAALKIYRRSSQGHKELEVLNHMTAVMSEHAGKAYVRTMIDSFTVNSSIGEHQCLVHEPLLLNLLEIQATLPRKRFTLELLKQTLKHLFLILDYLHTEAVVIHTDIQARNLILGTPDKSVYQQWDRAELERPSPRKVDGDTIIYESRHFKPEKGFDAWGLPILCDLGEARVGPKHKGLIQPAIFRAPEVVLGMEWDCKVDIWNVGAMAWHLFEDDHLFDGRILGKHSDAQLLAEITSLLGPPPREFLERSKESMKYWNDQGVWRGLEDTEIKPCPLEDSEEYLDGENYELFIKFMKKMLAWDPEERLTAAELRQDIFLNN